MGIDIIYEGYAEALYSEALWHRIPCIPWKQHEKLCTLSKCAYSCFFCVYDEGQGAVWGAEISLLLVSESPACLSSVSEISPDSSCMFTVLSLD